MFVVYYWLLEDVEKMIVDGKKVGILVDDIDEDIRFLREFFIYGLKGMAVYVYYVYRFGYKDDDVNNFFFIVFVKMLDSNLLVEEFYNFCMEFGKKNFRCMEILDKVYIEIFGYLWLIEVLIFKKKGLFIIVFGYDLKDLKDFLE